MTDASTSEPRTASKIGILVELQQRIAFVESKIQAADEEYEREVGLAGLDFKQKVRDITLKAVTEEFRVFLVDFRDSKLLLAGEIARLGHVSTQ